MYKKIISVLLTIALLFSNTIYAAPELSKAKFSCLRVPLIFDEKSPDARVEETLRRTAGDDAEADKKINASTAGALASNQGLIDKVEQIFADLTSESAEELRTLIDSNEAAIVCVAVQMLKSDTAKKNTLRKAWNQSLEKGNRDAYAVRLLNGAINYPESWQPFIDSVEGNVLEGIAVLKSNKDNFDIVKTTLIDATDIEVEIPASDKIDLTEVTPLEHKKLLKEPIIPYKSSFSAKNYKSPIHAILLGGSGSRFKPSEDEKAEFEDILAQLKENSSNVEFGFKGALPVPGTNGMMFLELQAGGHVENLGRDFVYMSSESNKKQAAHFVSSVIKNLKDRSPHPTEPKIIHFVQPTVPGRIPKPEDLRDTKDISSGDIAEFIEYCKVNKGQIALDKEGRPVFKPENHWDFTKYFMGSGFFLEVLESAMEHGRLKDVIMVNVNQDELGAAEGKDRPARIARNILIQRLCSEKGLYKFLDEIEKMSEEEWDGYRGSEKFRERLLDIKAAVVEAGAMVGYATGGGLFMVKDKKTGEKYLQTVEKANISGKLPKADVTNTNTITKSLLADALMLGLRPSDILSMINTKREQGDLSQKQKDLLAQGIVKIEQNIPARQQIKIDKEKKLPVQVVERDIHGPLGRIYGMIELKGHSVSTYTSKMIENDRNLISGIIDFSEFQKRERLLIRDLVFNPNKTISQYWEARRLHFGIASYLGYTGSSFVRPPDIILSDLRRKGAMDEDNVLSAFRNEGYYFTSKEDVNKAKTKYEKALIKYREALLSKKEEVGEEKENAENALQKTMKRYNHDLTFIENVLSNRIGTRLASNEGVDKFAQWDKWITKSVSMADFNSDMFRDYDYRSTGPVLKPEMVFRLGLVWADMALEKAWANGITDRRVLIAKDARKIEPELIEALAAALRYAGLDVIYIAAKGSNAVSSYSWAAQEYKPLMSIFLTASHVSQPKEFIVRGFKVAILDSSGTLQSLTSKEIMQVSKTAVKNLIENPEKMQAQESINKGKFIPSNIDANCVKMCALIGKTVASGRSLYSLARELEISKSSVTVLDNWDRQIGNTEPLKGITVVVEGANTPSGKLAADAFEQSGAKVILINGEIIEVEGEHRADPSKDSNLVQLKETIEKENANFGIAFDLDGDRGAIVVPWKPYTKEGVKGEEFRFVTLAPDNLIVALMSYIVKKGGYSPEATGKKTGVIRDVLGTFAVNDMALKLGIEAFQTDAGYVFLKALKQKLLPQGYIVPIYGERSGHSWLDVTGEFENPIAIAVLFATMVKEAKYKDDKTQSRNPFYETYLENSIPYLQSARFQPLFHPILLSQLSSDTKNNTGWVYNAEKPKNPPQAVIALGKDLGIQRLQKEFIVGKIYNTPSGNLKVKEFNTYKDAPDEGGLYRFADIVFEQDGKFAGRFVFRASSNDPTFACSFETPLMEGEHYTSESAHNRYISVGGVVLSWLEHEGIAGVTGNIKYPNKDVTEPIVIEYLEKIKNMRKENIKLASNETLMEEKRGASVIAMKLQDAPLDAKGNAAMAASFLRGGYGEVGYGVAEGASIHGSFALKGNQGYYAEGGKEAFLNTVNSMREFFERRVERLGKPIKYVIKTGVGGQHTPFQGIADTFQVINARTGKITGEYELGKDFEASMASVLRGLNADWDQVAVIPSSKSGSTDETMMVFVEIFYALLKNQAIKEGIDGAKFADAVLATLHEVNFINGKERPGKDLFKVDAGRFGTNNLITLISEKAGGLGISRDQVKDIFAKVLGNMFFETTDRVDQSRLSAFIHNSGLDTELGKDAPGFGVMFDNVGGRWTGDLHMMTFLAYHGLDAEKYWEIRREGIAKVKETRHTVNIIGNKILDEGITDIALVVPDEFFWFGKSNEQNFNESIWQKGFANLVAVSQSQWDAQKEHYVNNPKRLVINMSSKAISTDLFNVVKLDTSDFSKLDTQRLANAFAELFTTFYGITTVVGDRLIVRALKEAGYTADDVDMNDVNNPATKIVQQNLYVRQPYVEFGKGFLETRLKALQEKEAGNPGAIETEFENIKQLAREGKIETNIDRLSVSPNITNLNELTDAIRKASEFAKANGRKFVPFIYLEGDRFYNLRDYLISLGIEWVMQGTGDQHISYQQVLAQPQKYLPFIISFVPEKSLPGRPAIGFAKGYLDNVSPHMVRDLFAGASYKALTESRKDQGGLGLFLRIIDSEDNIGMLKQAAAKAQSLGAAQESVDLAVWEGQAESFEKKRTRGSSDFMAAVSDEIRPNDKVLEIAAGPFIFNAEAVMIAKAESVIVADLVPWNVDRLNKKIYEKGLQDKVSAQVLDMNQRFDFPDASFDVVISDIGLLQYVDNEQAMRTLQEIRRVLKPGGRLVFRVKSAEDYRYGQGEQYVKERQSVQDVFVRYDTHVPEIANLPRLSHFWSKETLTEILTMAGFKITNIDDSRKEVLYDDPQTSSLVTVKANVLIPQSQRIEFLDAAAKPQSLASNSELSRKKQIDSVNQIVAISATNIIDRENGKEWFRDWLDKQPGNIAVVIIAANIDEYETVRDLGELAYIKVVGDPADASIKALNLQDYQILNLDNKERKFLFDELDFYKAGVNLGARHSLDQKAVKAIGLGV